MYRETSTEFEWIHQNENRGDIIVLMSFLLIEWIDFPYFLDPIFNNMCVTGSEYSARQNSLSVHLELTFYSSKVHRNSRERKRKPDLDGPGRWLCQLSLRGMMGSQMVLGRTRHTKTDFSIPCFCFFFSGKGGRLGNCSPLWYEPLFRIASVFDGAKRHARHPCVSWFPCRYTQSTCVIRQCVLLGGNIVIRLVGRTVWAASRPILGGRPQKIWRKNRSDVYQTCR